jgi:hypothetical protein
MGGFIIMLRKEQWSSLRNRGLFLLSVFLSLGCRLARAGEINFDRIVFLSSWTKSSKVHFSNGQYREPAAPGSATELILKLTHQRAFRKLDGKEAGARQTLRSGERGSSLALGPRAPPTKVWCHPICLFLPF